MQLSLSFMPLGLPWPPEPPDASQMPPRAPRCLPEPPPGLQKERCPKATRKALGAVPVEPSEAPQTFPTCSDDDIVLVGVIVLVRLGVGAWGYEALGFSPFMDWRLGMQSVGPKPVHGRLRMRSAGLQPISEVALGYAKRWALAR